MVLEAGEVTPQAQQGLTDHQISQGLFLACQCVPQGDMKIALPGKLGKIPATLISKQWLNGCVVELVFETSMRWTAGQNITLWKDEEHGRAYSIASSRKYDGLLKLHVAQYEQGLVSRWCAEGLQEGDQVLLGEANGDCFYTEDAHDKPLLLVGTGTGLAPLYGVLMDALREGHSSEIHLYVAAAEPEGLYLVDQLQRLAGEHDNFHYHPVVRRQPTEEAVEGSVQGDLGVLIPKAHAALRGWKVFLCGSPKMIEGLRKYCFLAGAGGNDILFDAFEVAHEIY